VWQGERSFKNVPAHNEPVESASRAVAATEGGPG
jgi:hypothetical protein